ncbi:MAG: hypothetical protein AAFS11_10440, partial [Planctomycetota bacterium]
MVRIAVASLLMLAAAESHGQVVIEELYRNGTVLAGDRTVTFDPIAGLSPGVDGGKPVDYVFAVDLATGTEYTSLIEWGDDGGSSVVEETDITAPFAFAGYIPGLAEEGVQAFSLVVGELPSLMIAGVGLRAPGGPTVNLIAPGDAKPDGGVFTSPQVVYLRGGRLIVQDSTMSGGPGFARDSVHRVDVGTQQITQVLSRGDVVLGGVVDAIVTLGCGADGEVLASIEDVSDNARIVMFAEDGSQTLVVSSGDASPDGRLFDRFLSPPIRVDAGVVFSGRVAGTEDRIATYLWDGSTISTLVPGLGVLAFAVDDNDSLALFGVRDGDRVVGVIDRDGAYTEILTSAEPFMGLDVSLLGIGNDAIDGETVTFSGLFTDPVTFDQTN